MQKLLSKANEMTSIIKPHITEKAATSAQKGKYVFIVQKKANKIQIQKSFEKQYKITPQNINTARYLGKKITRHTKKTVTKGQKSLYKKAIITLKKGETLDLQSQAL